MSASRCTHRCPQLLLIKFENVVHSIFRNENSATEINVSHFGVLHWQEWQPLASTTENNLSNESPSYAAQDFFKGSYYSKM